MSDIISAAGLGWKLLAKIPWLAGWLLRRSFPVARCREMLRVTVPGTTARFELLAVRPAPALCCITVEIYNPLPFDVAIEFHRAQASCCSTHFLDAVLNERVTVPAARFASLSLPEFTLVGQTSNWIRSNTNECARLSFTLHWHCTSQIQCWESNKTFEFLAYVNKGAEDLHEEREL